jgi:methionyl aminopeptidase
MSFALRTAQEIEAIARAGQVVATEIDRAFGSIRVGDRACDVERGIADRLAAGIGEPALRGIEQPGRPPFPAVACVSVNEELPGAAPGERVIRDGDLVTIDLAVRVRGWHADGASTRVVGQGDRDREAFMEVGQVAFKGLLAELGPGVSWGVCREAFERAIGGAGVSIVADHAGHGIGRRLHEEPALPYVPSPADEIRLRPGMVFTVEPVLCRGGTEPTARRDPDGWTERFHVGVDVWTEERTVAIVPDGARVLTPIGPSSPAGPTSNRSVRGVEG